jgi:hypothetical protein
MAVSLHDESPHRSAGLSVSRMGRFASFGLEFACNLPAE